MAISKGFWRKNNFTDSIYECPNSKACLGGLKPLSQYPIECEKGYDGVLCHDCVKKSIDGERRYMRIGENQCSKCPDPFLNSVRIFSVLIMILFLIMMLIYFNIRKVKESEVSILGKILTNYLHMVSSSISFNIPFPNKLKLAITPVKSIAQSTETIISFDCFIKDMNISIVSQSEYLSKYFLSCIMPILVCLVFVLFFGLLKICKRKHNLKRHIIISMITIIYFFYPSLSDKIIRIFRC